MREFNKEVKLISYTVGEVNEKDLGLAVYQKMVEDLNGFLKIQSGYKAKVLDLFAGDSFVNETKPEWFDYQSSDVLPSYQRNNINYVVDICSSPNNLPLPSRSIDIVFCVGNKSFYGENHQSLLEVERILKPGGMLIAALSKFWFFKEFSQLLIGYRKSFSYFRAIEILYNILETKTNSGRYFCYYHFKG